MARTASPKQIAYINSLAQRSPETYSLISGQLGVDTTDLNALTGKQASDLLDALIPAARPASDKQIAFARELEAKVPQFCAELTRDMGVTDLEAMSAKQASFLLDALVPAARRADTERRVIQEAEAAASGLTEGVYMRNGTPIKVYPPREKAHGVLLAKQLTSDGTWAYLGAASRFVTVDMRITAEEAKQYGADFGICCCCGRELTDEKSIMLGVGPVCWKKYI